jgi:PPE-repeat protein
MAGMWSAFPPEVNAGQLMAGDQGASIAAAAAAYEALSAALMEEGARMGTTAGTTAATGWEGMGGAAMVATAMPYVAALEALAGWVQQSAASAAAIEQAYATAKAAMIPVPVCTDNRVTQAGLVLSNIIGQNTIPINILDDLYGEFWGQNAGNMGGYEGIVTAIIAALGIPPPPAPLTANPAGPASQAAAIGQAAANGAANAAMSQSLQGVEQASGGVQAGAAAPAGAAQSMGSMAPQMMSQLGQLPQMLGQFPQMLGQFPQMLGQFPQMAMGMLGPLTSGMNAGGGTAGLEKAAGALDPTTMAATTDAAARGGGGGGAGGLGGAGGVMSSFTRPTGSFNAPGPPKLPTGWTPGAAAAPEAATAASPAAGGGSGGLYGAPPPHTGRDERGKDGAAEGRTMQLTVGPRSGREG